MITDIYHKQKDTQKFIHIKSHHTKNCIKSIAYTLAHRLHTIIPYKNLRKTRIK